MVTVRDNGAKGDKEQHMIFVNLHFHNPMEDLALGDYLRKHQCEHMLFFLQKRQKEFAGTADRVIVSGDFNTEPGGSAYRMMHEFGFKSSHNEVNGQEPKETYRPCIEAPFADPDPPACFDYIFFKGTGLEPFKSKVTAYDCVPGDPTLYASDHMAIVTDFKL